MDLSSVLVSCAVVAVLACVAVLSLIAEKYHVSVGWSWTAGLNIHTRQAALKARLQGVKLALPAWIGGSSREGFCLHVATADLHIDHKSISKPSAGDKTVPELPERSTRQAPLELLRSILLGPACARLQQLHATQLGIAELRVNHNQKGHRVVSSISNLHLSLARPGLSLETNQTGLACKFGSASLSIQTALGPVHARTKMVVQHVDHGGSSAACLIKLLLDDAEQAQCTFGPGMQCTAAVHLLGTAPRGQPDTRTEAGRPVRHAVLSASLTLLSQLKAGLSGGQGATRLQAVSGRVNTHTVITPSLRGSLSVTSTSMDVSLQHSAAETSVAMSTEEDITVCITNPQAAHGTSADGLVPPPSSTLTLSQAKLTITKSRQLQRPDMDEAGSPGVLVAVDARADELRLESSLLSAQDGGAFGQWLYDVKGLRKVLFRGSRSTPGVSPPATTEERTALPPWLELSTSVRWQTLQICSLPNVRCATPLPRVSLHFRNGSVAVHCPAAQANALTGCRATRDASQESASALQGPSTLLRNILVPEEFALFEASPVADVLCFHISVESESATVQIEPEKAASVHHKATSCGCLIDIGALAAHVGLVAFTPAMKQFEGFRRKLFWRIDQGLLTASSASETQAQITVSNAAPACLAMDLSLNLAAVKAPLHFALLAGLKQLAPVFSQFSTVPWTRSHSQTGAWFNKMSRCMRLKLAAQVGSVSVSTECNEVSFSNVELSNTQSEAVAAFVIKASAESICAHSSGSQVLRADRVGFAWHLRPAVDAPRHEWLPSSSESVDSFLDRTILGPVQSFIDVEICGKLPGTGMQQASCAIFLGNEFIASASEQVRAFSEGTLYALQQHEMAARGALRGNTAESTGFQVQCTSVGLSCSSSGQGIPGVSVQLNSGKSAETNPCMLADGVQLRWMSSNLGLSSALQPKLSATLNSIALFAVQMPKTQPLGSALRGTLLPEAASPQIMHDLRHMFRAHGAVHYSPAQQPQQANEPWPSLLHDILPVAFAEGLEILLCQPPQRHLTVKTSNTKAVYSNFGHSCYKQWVMSCIELYKSGQNKESHAILHHGQSTAAELQPVTPAFSWACELDQVQMILYAAQDSGSDAVRGSYMSPATGSIRIETPALRISSLLASSHASSQFDSTQATASQASGSPAMAAAGSAHSPAGRHVFPGHSLPLTVSGETPKTSVSEKQTFDSVGGYVPETVPSPGSHGRPHSVPLPLARSKAASREHAIHFSAKDIQAFFVAPGTGFSAASLSELAGSGRVAPAEAQHDFAEYPWALSKRETVTEGTFGAAAAETCLSEHENVSIGGSTERMVLSNAVLYVGVGLKKLSLIDNFKLLHGQGDLAASTRVTVDVSAAEAEASLDELAEVTHVLKSLAQQSSGRSDPAPLAFTRNLAVYVEGAAVTIRDSHSWNRKLSVHLTEAEVASRYTSVVAIPSEASVKRPVDAGWSHSLSVSLGWLHTTLVDSSSNSLSKTIALADIEPSVDAVLLGGCFLDGVAPHATSMAKASVNTHGSFQSEQTEVHEVSVHIFPDANAAIILNLTPDRIRFLASVLQAVSGAQEAGGDESSAEEQLLGPASTKQTDKTLSPEKVEQATFDVLLVHMSRAVAIVSADGFLRKPLRHLQVELPPLRLHNLEQQTSASLGTCIGDFYTKQVWDYVPRVLKKSVLPNLKASFTPKKLARKREQRNHLYNAWRPAALTIPPGASSTDGGQDETEAAARTSPGGKSREATYALLGI